MVVNETLVTYWRLICDGNTIFFGVSGSGNEVYHAVKSLIKPVTVLCED